MNLKCQEAIDKRKIVFKSFKARPSLDGLRRFQEEIKLCKKTLREIRADSFKNFCEDLNVHTDTTRVWRTLRAFRSRHSTMSSNSKGNQLERARDVFDSPTKPINMDHSHHPYTLVNSSLFSSNENSPEIDDTDSSESAYEKIKKYLFLPFSEKEFESALSKLKVRTAHWPYLISNEILLSLHIEVKKILLKLFNIFFLLR